YLPTVTAKDGYKWTGWVVTNKAGETILDLGTDASSIAFNYGVADDYTVTAKFEEVKPEVAVANADVVVDLEKGSFDGYEGTAKLENKNLQEADYTLGYLPTVTAKDGYKWTGWVVTNKAGETILDLGTDASSIAFNYGVADNYTVTAKFEEVKPEEKEARDVIVNFNVDPEKGEFTDPAGAKVVTFTIKEDDGNQYLVPTVEAKEGYVFTGWLVNGEDEGHWDADAKTFGVTGLAHFPEGSNEGYVTVTAQFEEVKPEVAVANANVVVDPDKGSFDGYDGATTLNNEHLEEADYTLGYLPTVTANDGYKWTGWVVTNKAGETILDLDT
ncbi:InlB B-repeat-containing protein, partial [Mediterraneibacter faecis]|uniref:InlB B-repeat-containing protein n=1 Tax=Mediterraneibacter faecis TaxID=592978 RepID=UPI003F8BCB72